MKNSKIKVLLLLVALASGSVNVRAQDLKSLITGVIETVVGNKASAESLIGTWEYTGPACRFESENMLAQAGGTVASSAVEEKMTEMCAKIKLDEKGLTYTFNDDGTYSSVIGKTTSKGTYTFDPETNIVSMKTRIGVKSSAVVIIVGSKMELLFDADKMMGMLKTVSSTSTKLSSNSTIKVFDSFINQYDGLKLGYELKSR